MKRTFFITVVFLLVSSMAFGATELVTETKSKAKIPNTLGYVSDRIVVKFDPSGVAMLDKRLLPHGKTGIGTLDGVGARHGVASIQRQFPNTKKKVFRGKTLDLSGWHEIKFSGKVDVQAVVAEYKSTPGVIDAQVISLHPIFQEPQPLTPNDQFYSSQWHLPKIKAPVAWNIEAGNPAVIVAVLDTGVRYFQKDLGGSNASYYNPAAIDGNMWVNEAEYYGTPGVDNDGNGYVNDWIGWDFVRDGAAVGFPLYPCFSGEDCITEDNDPRDFNGHGTHCACNVSAINNNSEAVCSVAGGWGNGTLGPTGNGVKIMALRVGWSATYLSFFEAGLVDMSYAARAFQYAADKGAKIATCSWGSENAGAIQEAVEYFLASGGMIFMAAGNDGADSPGFISTLPYEGIVNVAATDQSDCKASFSNYGSWVDIAAPGVQIWSCYHNKLDVVEDYVMNMDGTSMATPMAAGVAALIWSQNPSMTASQVKAQLLGSADRIDGLVCNASYAGKLGAGRINAFAAVSASPPPPQETPTAPTGLTASVASSSQINLAWSDNADNEDGFKIERCAGSGCTSFAQIATVGPNETSFSNTGLTASTTYTYRVRAYNLTGDSGYSNAASATTQAPTQTIPTAPSRLSASAVSRSQINLKWSDRSNNEDGFKIERCEGARCSQFQQIATVGAGVTTFSNTGLKTATSYSYRVRAYNSAGSSAYSNTASVKTRK